MAFCVLVCWKSVVRYGDSMKSSTLVRSHLSKEKMEVLAALSKYRQELGESESPDVYVRPDKEQEIDLLWQNFKSNQKFDKSPGIYLTSGFIAGVVTVLIISGIVGLFSNGSKAPVEEALVSPQEAASTVEASSESKKKWFGKNDASEVKVENDVVPIENKLYQVKNGDTMSNILIQFYGNASKENEEKVLKANGMSNPNKLMAGEKIKIPVEFKN